MGLEGVGCVILGFGGIIGGMFLDRKLDDRLRREGSSLPLTFFLSSTSSLNKRPRRKLFPLSGTTTESDILLRTIGDDFADP